VRVRVWKVGDPKRARELELLVDTGSTYTVIDSDVLRGIGVEPRREVPLRIADGSVVKRDYGEVGVEIEGLEVSATPVIFGDKGVFLLGAVTLEQLGLAPDPVQKRLVPTTAFMMFLVC